MAKNTVSRISSAFAAGGGGVNFEQNIQALFLLSLLVEGFCPVINEPIKRVCFQVKHVSKSSGSIISVIVAKSAQYFGQTFLYNKNLLKLRTNVCII